MHRLRRRRIEFAVPNPRARAHPLHVARAYRRTVADRILVRKRTGKHVADDFHIAMAMRAESLSGLDPVLIDHTERAELDMPRIEIVRERKAVERLEPAMVGVAAFAAASYFVHRCSFNGPHAERPRYGTSAKNTNAAKITRCTTPCITCVRPETSVIDATTKLSMSSTSSFGSRPSASGTPSSIDATATAGIVKPMLASAEPNARFRLV